MHEPIQARVQLIHSQHQVIPGGKRCLAGNNQSRGAAALGNDLRNGGHQVVCLDG
ncbi:hypothetical protein JJD71_09775 [Pseudomonas haemolytica]|uniref:Uncharacterized protein n=1 Tax=Pseudomonas haemolytica TaxID=2600065 RepID=A0ABS1GR98_9PSED|nr:hypothetical protein [Pseudomonas sp. MF6755]MBJ2284569.1 hypothetical protein [Pseudomonas sp. MF6755]MBK3459352.1 hypothetical protein [Pseudomonas haemolytica]